MSRQHQQSQKFLEHFALIYVDREGNLRHEVSASILDSAQSILSPEVTGAFLKAVAESRTSSQLEPFKAALASNVPRTPEKRAIQREIRRARTEEQDWNAGTAISPITAQIHVTAQLPVNQRDLLRRYYEKVFQNLKQANCRAIAKIYIRLVEPRKHVQYPYNGRKSLEGKTQQLNPEETKPPWWPLRVTHREPDHLPKSERIALLIHMLCELRISHGITARKLKNAGRLVQHQITPTERLQLLDELYRVREEEEKLLDAVTDRNATVSISRANLPEEVSEDPSENLPENQFDDFGFLGQPRDSSSEESRGSQKVKLKLPIQPISTSIQSSRWGWDTPECQYHIMNDLCQRLVPASPSSSSRGLKRKHFCIDDGILPIFPTPVDSSFPSSYHPTPPDYLMHVPWNAGVEQ